ncbi:hypothetical protein BDP27DRAFT_1434393 [Rhodocollybia butyracea]|uniref:Uncharacterized protein n=1 Tax=Rhodocollybia butyracea TaxID=206335 RepID=A0A9P5P3K4_9AGAR|nr:hypothetical protein BDP27DRAFT_1434393 [Rhodocollybia butyracea]
MRYLGHQEVKGLKGLMVLEGGVGSLLLGYASARSPFIDVSGINHSNNISSSANLTDAAISLTGISSGALVSLAICVSIHPHLWDRLRVYERSNDVPVVPLLASATPKTPLVHRIIPTLKMIEIDDVEKESMLVEEDIVARSGEADLQQWTPVLPLPFFLLALSISDIVSTDSGGTHAADSHVIPKADADTNSALLLEPPPNLEHLKPNPSLPKARLRLGY